MTLTWTYESKGSLMTTLDDGRVYVIEAELDEYDEQVCWGLWHIGDTAPGEQFVKLIRTFRRLTSAQRAAEHMNTKGKQNV